jgi:hypothetical protein
MIFGDGFYSVALLHVMLVPRHHGMARQVADGGEGIQMWRVAGLIE